MASERARAAGRGKYAEETGKKFSEAVFENEIVREKIGEKMISKCLEPKNYVGHSSEIVDRVLNSVQ